MTASWIYYVPMLLLGAWTIYIARTLPDWRDARFLTHPENRVWSFVRVFNDSEWTEEGRILRGKYLRRLGVGLAIAVTAWLFVAAYAEKQERMTRDPANSAHAPSTAR